MLIRGFEMLSLYWNLQFWVSNELIRMYLVCWWCEWSMSWVLWLLGVSWNANLFVFIMQTCWTSANYGFHRE